VPRRRQFATISDRIDQLMLDVFVPDERERIPRLAEHLAPDFVFVSPTAVFEGAQGLSDAYSTYRHDEWLQVVVRRTSEVDAHHAHFRFAWERSERGKPATRGWSFGWVDAGGRISRIVTFNDPVPTRAS
jgi:ketosteroid isomerase-like protein